MTIDHHFSSSSSTNASPSLLDALYCEEEEEELWEEEEAGEREIHGGGLMSSYDGSCTAPPPTTTATSSAQKNPSLFPLLLLEQDLFWEDEELLSLFSKEQQIHLNIEGSDGDSDGFSSSSSVSSAFSLARGEAVVWMLKVNSYYGFSTLTAILSINYLDRFLSKSPQFHQNENNNYTIKPWLIQLVAVTCLSLAAKVEETHVPLLLDLQVEGTTKYVFEAKTIQKMELHVLSTLNWKMNTVTPISFLHHVIRRLGLKTHLHWEFLRRCERLLLSVVADSRFVRYLPSVLATSTMMHVIDQLEPSNPLDYQNQLLGVLNISKGKVKDCHELIVGMSSISSCSGESSVLKPSRKRKPCHGYYCRFEFPAAATSPVGAIDAGFGSDRSSDESWALSGLATSSSLPSWSASSSSPLAKKSNRVHREQCTPPPPLLPSLLLGRVFMDAVGATTSPR